VAIASGKNDARRIVACVNACAGVTTEELEQGGFVSGLIEQRDELAKLCNYNERLMQDCLRLAEEAPRWRDVVDELPQEAQEVLFVRDGKTVHGAWIGGIFWHSNKKMAAAQWMPLPKPPTAALARRRPVAWIRFCSDGCYEGPIMDAQIEDVRKQSGAWTPLYKHNDLRLVQVGPCTCSDHECGECMR
jgi:hypothetical protein